MSSNRTMRQDARLVQESVYRQQLPMCEPYNTQEP
jgi:hypothetical protein